MDKADVIIIGAGAAGLAAAYELSLLNKKVIMLEARNRLGGRIHSIQDERFNNIIETGAEFIHGRLPYTLSLLKKAGIQHHVSGGKMYRVYKGKLQKTEEFIRGWDEVMDRLNKLPHDMPIAEFLNHYFAGEQYKELRASMLGYVEGYDAADATKASSFALREEWEEEEEEQGRIDNGYHELMNFLADECRQRGGTILLSHNVNRINWHKDNVEMATADVQMFYAQKAIITLPLGLWQRMETDPIVSFMPRLPHKVAAAQQMGFGGVIKFNFQFSTAFWEENIPHKMKNAGFILSDAEIPTWWAQNPKDTCILTGWIAGPRTTALKDLPEDQLLQKAVHSLASIFSVHEQFILNRLKTHRISNWLTDPY